MLELDLNTEFGARVAHRLEHDRIIWLTTVDANLTPQPVPVWFLWEGPTMLIYSRPNTPKLRNIERNPQVALNFDGDGYGGNIIVFTGSAALAPDAPQPHEIAAYATKYAEGFKRIGMSAERFSEVYSVALRVTLTRVRGH